mmetsp:Transcript_49661/g.74957  ORF Transcript_49661/g.74957 Transcript_49661/m.74957 type:complete len:80 (-) Transcript_49661:704-943(-)
MKIVGIFLHGQFTKIERCVIFEIQFAFLKWLFQKNVQTLHSKKKALTISSSRSNSTIIRPFSLCKHSNRLISALILPSS